MLKWFDFNLHVYQVNHIALLTQNQLLLKTIYFCGGGMDIFWNYTISVHVDLKVHGLVLCTQAVCYTTG